MVSRRVGFMGASGTGKTTLAKFIAEEFGLEINPVGSRAVAQAMGFDSPYGVDAAGKRAEFQRRLLGEKTAWEAERSSFVSDRTTLDNLAYTTLHGVEAIDEEMLEKSFEGLARYTEVFFCPMASHFKVGDDPARAKSVAYHRVYESVLRGLRVSAFEKFRGLRNPQFFVIPYPTLSERKAFVRDVLA